MFRKPRLLALFVIAMALALLSPNTALAKKHREPKERTRRTHYAITKPPKYRYYSLGYDAWGNQLAYGAGFYDPWGKWVQ